MGNRTTLVDNNTWNNSHIALVGLAMSSNETEAYKVFEIIPFAFDFYCSLKIYKSFQSKLTKFFHQSDMWKVFPPK